MNDFGLIRSKNKIKKQNGEFFDADFGQAHETKRLGVHWVEVPPGVRTSHPHAESLEEEFIFVLKGHPHIWVNGYLYELRPGLAVGFPSGTGIAHNVLNNTSETVELIVLGERTKKENKCSFPVNPEMKATHDWIWWENPPPQVLGPHLGNIGDLDHQKDWRELPFIQDVFALTPSPSFSYRGDIETFGQGVRITPHVGLKELGVWFEKLKPGYRASWPHAHKLEEEFGLILKGKPRVWLNGFESEMQEGDGVFFRPQTNIAHTLINDSHEEVWYLNIGLADDGGPNENIIYPLHETRNEQCQRAGYLWEQAPVVEMGSSFGLPRPRNLEISWTSSVSDFLAQASEELYKKEELYSHFIGICEIELARKEKATPTDYFILKNNGEWAGACFIHSRFLILTQISEPHMPTLVENILARSIHVPGVLGPDMAADHLTRLLAKAKGQKRRLGMSQQVYTLKVVKKPLPIEGEIRFAMKSEADLLTDWLVHFHAEALPHETMTREKLFANVLQRIEKNEIYVWSLGQRIVAMNMVGRPTRNGISISGVYTPPSERKKGYASALVAATSEEQLKLGKKFCVLYTDATNPTSNKIYQSIGFEEIARSKHYILE